MYGREMLALVRGYVKTSKRIVAQRQHLAFNSRCKRYQLIPKYLRVTSTVPSYDGSRIAERASRQFLCAQIDHNHRIARRLEQNLRHRREVLAESMRICDLSILDSLKADAQKKEEEKCKSRQKRKFDMLMRSAQKWGRRTHPVDAQKCQRNESEEHPKWVVNLSSRSLSTSEHALLQKGLNFAPAPSRMPTARIVAAVECGLREVPEEKAELARTKIVGAIAKARPPPVNLLPQERKAIKTLQEDDQILVLPADKGRTTVVMDRARYDEKMNSLLDNRKTYKKLTKDPTPAIERKMNALLLQLKKKGAITDDLYSRLRSSAGRLPLLYGLPKNEVGASQLAEACRIYCSPIPAWIRNSCRRFDRVAPVFFRAKIVIDRGRVFLMPANRINCNHCSRATCQWVSDLLGWSSLMVIAIDAVCRHKKDTSPIDRYLRPEEDRSNTVETSARISYPRWYWRTVYPVSLRFTSPQSPYAQ